MLGSTAGVEQALAQLVHLRIYSSARVLEFGRDDVGIASPYPSAISTRVDASSWAGGRLLNDASTLSGQTSVRAAGAGSRGS